MDGDGTMGVTWGDAAPCLPQGIRSEGGIRGLVLLWGWRDAALAQCAVHRKVVRCGVGCLGSAPLGRHYVERVACVCWLGGRKKTTRWWAGLAGEKAVGREEDSWAGLLGKKERRGWRGVGPGREKREESPNEQ